MLLSLTATAARPSGSGTDPSGGYVPATDLGFLLHKHPDRVRKVDMRFGTAHVFYPEATEERCEATLLVEVDPVRLTRRPRGGPSANLEPYVNDRPYAASSFLSVAIGRLYGSALAGSCDERPKLVDRPLPLEITIPVLPVRGGETVLRRLFEPLGYGVTAQPLTLDDTFPGWGLSRYLSVSLRIQAPVRNVLSHLYVLLPVLDDAKHYWVGESEVEKLLRRGEDWLAGHPEHELITRRYLLHRRGLAREALAQLIEDGDDPDAVAAAQDEAEGETERPLSLNEQRLNAVVEAVTVSGAHRVVDLGCGEGRLLQRFANEPALTKICGVDVSVGALERAARRVRRELTGHRPDRVELIQGALTYLDRRLADYDAATVVEVIEHLDHERLDVFTEILFGHIAPDTVIVTTPNIEYNVHFESLDPSKLRHGDHRFEWTRAEFGAWCDAAASANGYAVALSGIGPDDDQTGPPTQMAVFTKLHGAVDV